MGNIRAFIAIELSPRLKDTIVTVQSELKKAGGDVKWVPPEICHITIKFLGEVREEQIRPIHTIIDECAGCVKPFSITVQGVGAFPTMDKPNIIWLGVKDERAILAGLARDMEDKISKLGFINETRPFTPHITIGRTRAGSHRILSQALTSLTFPNDLLNVTALTFFQSTLFLTGPTYVPQFTSLLKP